MDELGERIPVERTLVEEIVQSAVWFNESFWPAGVPPEDEEERRAVLASWVARIRGEPTATPPARRFAVACTDRLAAYASLTDEAAARVTKLGGSPLVENPLTDEEGCAVMATLAGRLPALRSIDVSAAQLHALVPVWREMAAAGRPAVITRLFVVSNRNIVPGAPVPPLPPLGDLLPRLQSLYLSVDEPEYAASWCAMLAGEGAPALVGLTLPAPFRDALPDEQAAMYVDVLRRQAGSLRKLVIEPFRMSAGAADALDAVIVALPHLVNLHTNAFQVEGSVRVLGGRAPHLRSVTAQCSHEVEPAACLTAWLRGLAPSVEQVAIRNLDVLFHARTSAGWDELAVALRALGGRPAFRSLLLSAGGVHGVPWLQCVLSPSSDVAAAPVWPHLEQLMVFGWFMDPSSVELDLGHFPHLRKIDSDLQLSASTVAGVMRNAVCRDGRLQYGPFSLTAADAAALTPKERLVAGLTADTADETVATLASVVGGWSDLRELKLYATRETVVIEATQMALLRALGRCTQLRELCLPFPLYPAAAATLAEGLQRLPEVTRLGLDNVTTSSLLVVVRGLLGTGRHAGDAARTLRARVIGAGDPATSTDDLRELGLVVAVAGQQGWAAIMESNQSAGRTPLELLSQVQALALRRDWRDCIAPLCRLDVTPAGYTLQLRPCGLVGWERSE
jgi:hypothetical protein